MNAGQLKEWLTDVPDDFELVAAPADETVDGRVLQTTYTVEPVYFKQHRKVAFVFGGHS